MFEDKRVVLASNNPGKTREINALLQELEIEVLSQGSFNVPEIEETGLTFVENALLKARNAARFVKHPVIADDSGIAVDGLKGKPGIYSARYAGVGATDEDNLHKLIDKVKTLPESERSAQFVCVMVYLRHAEDPIPIIAEGIWEGKVITEPKGDNGFGYDPMFYVPTHQCTSAQLPPEVKNQLSHRGLALMHLVNFLRSRQ